MNYKDLEEIKERNRPRLARIHWHGWISMALIFLSGFAIAQGHPTQGVYLGLGAPGLILIQILYDWIIERSMSWRSVLFQTYTTPLISNTGFQKVIQLS